jgi:hypothetical protein
MEQENTGRQIWVAGRIAPGNRIRTGSASCLPGATVPSSYRLLWLSGARPEAGVLLGGDSRGRLEGATRKVVRPLLDD